MSRFDHVGRELLKAGIIILLGTSFVVLTFAPAEQAPSPVAKLQTR